VLRERRGLSGKEVEALTGINSETLMSWETGYRTMRVHFLIELASFYEVDPAALLNGTGQMSPAAAGLGS
jgi:transcriptional regulator with XRE-family HTH domain